MSFRELRIFLSSTSEFAAIRERIAAHVRPLQHIRLDYMEDFGALPGGAIGVCRDKVKAADVFVGLTGFGRGWEPPGDNELRSITEMEYDWAVEAGHDRLMFVAPDAAAMSAPAQPPEAASRQTAFRKRVLAENVVDARFLKGELSHPADVTSAVMAAIQNVTIQRVLANHAAPKPAPPPPAPALQPAPKRTLMDWLLGRKPAGLIREARDIAAYQKTRAPGLPPASPPPVAEPTSAQNAPPEITGPLAAFAADPAYAALFADPAAFDIAKLEAAVTARGEARLLTANERLAAERRATAADYKRLAELTGFFDIEKARRYWGLAYAADPTDGMALHQFAEHCRATGRSAEAQAAFERFDPSAGAAADLSGAYWAQLGYGDLLAETGDLSGALTAFRGASEVAAKEAKADPADVGEHGSAMTLGWQRDLSVSYNKVGDVLVAQGNLPDALKAFRDSLDIRDRLAKADPGNAGWQADLAASSGNSTLRWATRLKLCACSRPAAPSSRRSPSAPATSAGSATSARSMQISRGRWSDGVVRATRVV